MEGPRGIDPGDGMQPGLGKESNARAKVLDTVSKMAVERMLLGLDKRKIRSLDDDGGKNKRVREVATGNSRPLKKTKTTRERYREAVGFLHNGNPGRGFFILQQLTEKGDFQAKVRMASCYFMGDGVQMDRKRAVGIWQETAVEGDAFSQASLSSAYRDGMGIEQNLELAKYWADQAKQPRK